MRAVARIAAFAIGLIGAIDALIINFFVSLYHEVQRLTGADPNSHGWLGLLIVAVALVGSFAVLFSPRIGGVLLLIAGIAFFFVVHGWAILASPQMLVGGLIPFVAEGTGLGRELAPQESRRAAGGPPMAAQQ